MLEYTSRELAFGGVALLLAIWLADALKSMARDMFVKRPSVLTEEEVDKLHRVFMVADTTDDNKQPRSWTPLNLSNDHKMILDRLTEYNQNVRALQSSLHHDQQQHDVVLTTMNTRLAELASVVRAQDDKNSKAHSDIQLELAKRHNHD